MKKITGVLIIIAILAVSLYMEAETSANTDFSEIRVKISINRSTISITPKGEYYIAEKPGIRLPPGNYTLTKSSSNQVRIQGNGIDERINNTLTLVPLKHSDLLTLKGTDYGTVDYHGKIRFIATSSSNLDVVNHVPFEKYLYGVVAYEMSNSFPLEALKAQAVSARGYAARRIKNTGTYDVVDTTVHQVYKGYNSSYGRVIQAVDETKGQVLEYNGRMIDTYYAASNGGQTELPGNTWGGGAAKNKDFPYLAQKDDPYDLRNSASLTEHFFVPKEVTDTYGTYDGQEVVRVTVAEGHNLNVRSGPGTSHSVLGQVTRDNLLPYISTEGSWHKVYFQVGADTKEAYVHRDYAKKETVKSDKRYQYFSPVLQDMQKRAFDRLKSENINILEVSDVKVTDIKDLKNGTARYPGTGSRSYVSANAKVTVQYHVNGGSSLSSKRDVDVTLELMRKNSSGNFINSHPYFNGNLRMRNVESAEGGYLINNLRYGHGVGMSQRGAQQMAAEGKKHTEILAFYFDGSKIMNLDTSIPDLPDPPPANNPTPKLTSTTYNISSDQITGISPKTRVEAFIKEIKVENGTIKLVDKDGKEKKSGNVATGDVVEVRKSSSGSVESKHTVTIKGDVNGNGDVGILDLLRVQRHLLGTTKLSGPYSHAADVTASGSIGILDLLRIQRHLLGIATISQ